MTTSAGSEDGKSSIWRRLLALLHLQPKGQQSKTTYSYFSLFKPLDDLQSRIILFLGVILSIAAGAPLPIIGVIFAKIIDVFPPSEEEVRARICQLLAVAISYFVVTWGWTFCWGIVGARISRGLRTQMVDRALRLDQTYYETICPDITSRLTVDAQAVQAGTAEKVGLFLQSVSYFIVAFIVGFTLNAQLTGILFAAVIPSMTIVIIIGTSYLDRFSKQATQETTSAATVAEGAIKAVQVVQAFDAFETLTADHQKHLKSATRIGTRKAVAAAILLGAVFFIAYAANALAFWQGSQIIKKSDSAGGAGTIYAIVFLILDASFVIGQAGPFIQSFSAAASAGRRIFSLIDYPDIPIDVYSQRGLLADDDTFGPGKEIELENVSFTYPARPLEQVLNSVDIRIRTGSTVGIVGASGSGKSTIAALLLRLYDPSEGHIKVDGHQIPEYQLSSLRKQIALVDQDPAIFSGTVYSNIVDGFEAKLLPEAEMRHKCMLAAKAADAWTFIEALPKGLDTSLGDPDGTKLSGGQKQRLCLARALVGDPTVLVLDESTSGLDAISEKTILDSLGKARSLGHRTTIMIAHRLASVMSADNIIVMGKGCVLEQGDHSTLMAKEYGAYRMLIEAQKFLPSDSSEDISETKTVVAEEGTINERDLPGPTAITALPDVREYGTFTILKRCLALSRSKIIFVGLALLGSLTTGALIIGESIIFGHLVSLLDSPVASDKVNLFCLMFFVVALAALCGYVTSGTCFGIVSEHLIQQTRDISLRTILRQDMDWFLQPGRSTSSLVSVISMDSGHLSGLSGVIIGTVVSALVAVLGGAILAHIVAWKIAIVLFATSPVIILSGFYRLRVLAKLEENNQRAYTEAASLATEALSSIRTIAALGIETATSKNFHLAVDKYRVQTFRQTALGNFILAFALAITYFVYALAYWWGARNVRSGEYSSLQFFIVLPAVLFSAQTAGQIFSLAPDISRAKGAASRVFALHDQQPSIDAIKPEREKQTITPEFTQLGTSGLDSLATGSITFQNVFLSYKSRPSVPVFQNLNLHIRAGETVALVGRSGAGKTSTISLIERFYDPTQGAILIDGVDIRSVSPSQHRARISLVSQEPDLFAGSVAFNVGLGVKPGCTATRQMVEDACKAVGIHDFVVGLPDGYETQCGINGSLLSGGQKQRIAIARAYIRSPEILLLDEATASLDSISETQIQDAISVAATKRTTIIIAHRLSSVQKADRILVFDKGVVVEEGRHEVLARAGGIYEAMVRAQGLG